MSKLKNNDDNLKKFKALKKEKNESVGDYAVRVIEYNIINMSLPPGTFISEITGLSIKEVEKL